MAAWLHWRPPSAFIFDDIKEIAFILLQNKNLTRQSSMHANGYVRVDNVPDVLCPLRRFVCNGKTRTLVLAYGSWGAETGKTATCVKRGNPPTIGVGLMKKLSKRFIVSLTPEHYTSQTCCQICFRNFKNSKKLQAYAFKFSKATKNADFLNVVSCCTDISYTLLNVSSIRACNIVSTLDDGQDW